MGENNKLDITSTVLEKSIDAATGFLSKLVSPSIETAGLILRDHFQQYRFKQQIKLLQKTKQICEANNISHKSISLKMLLPLLNDASLEEDDKMLDNWAVLLSNLVDSEQNIQNHVFPYFLSQLSLTEFNYLKKNHAEVIDQFKSDSQALEQATYDLEIRKPIIQKRMAELRAEIKKLTDQGANLPAYFSVNDQIQILNKEHTDLINKCFTLSYQKPFNYEIGEDNLQPFEIANLERLGLIQTVNYPSLENKRLSVEEDRYEPEAGSFIDFNLNVQSDFKMYFTELGILFMNACTEKQNQYSQQDK
ncbi:MAG: hypothetical protein ACKVOR_09530 [Flavobacteriales bacterium]